MTSVPTASDRASSGAVVVDVGLAVLLFATVALYLAALPLTLGAPDEAHALLAAKRVGAGEALYRDVFDVSTPLWIYVMAALFRLFGTTLATARLTVAAIHAITAVLIFATCRSLRVRRALAWSAGLAYLVICQPLFPVASYHWLSTCLCALLLFVCLRRNDSPWSAFALGIIVGLLIAVHQQRGSIVGLGVAALLVIWSLLRWRYEGGIGAGNLLHQLAALGGGALLIVVPIMAAVVARAGLQPVWEALIVFPLASYRTAHRAAHYGLTFDSAPGGPPPITVFLRYLPLAAVLSAASLLPLAWKRRCRDRVRRLTILTVLGGFAVASIMYYPDVIHLALIAPVFFVALAEFAEWTLALVPPGMNRALGLGIAAVIVVTGSLGLFRTAVALNDRYPVAYESAFGRIDLPSARQREFWEQLRALLDAAPRSTLYAYPMANYAHLLVDAPNPTRFAFVLPSTPYSPPEQLQEIVDVLATKRVPYVIASRTTIRADDPIARYIREHYESLQAPPVLRDVIWQRKPDGAEPNDGGG